MQYYTSNSNLQFSDINEQILLLGQMVYDENKEDNTMVPVVLIYDLFWPQKQVAVPVITRYHDLQKIRSCIEGKKLGLASMSVQWAGDVCHRTKLYNMQLPHKMKGLLLLQDDFCHTQIIALDPSC